MIADPNFVIFELLLVFQCCDIQTELFLDLVAVGNSSGQWITESLGLPYRTVLGHMFGNVGGGITEPKSF